VLGWGDGLAAIIGEAHGGTRLCIWGRIRVRRRGSKSVAGTAAMFAASFAVTLIFTLVFSTRFGAPGSALGISAVVALAATAVEAFTPLGIDNITVPLATALLYAGVFA
jgi:phytol kinase